MDRARPGEQSVRDDSTKRKSRCDSPYHDHEAVIVGSQDVLGCLTGLLLAGRYKILATVPVQLAAMVFAAMPTLIGQASLGHQFAAWVVFCLTLQAAYVARLAVGRPATGRAIQVRPRNA